MGYSARTPLSTPARPSTFPVEKKPNLSPPPSHDDLRISELTFTKDRPRGKGYSHLFGKPGSVLFGIGTRDGGARGQPGGLDGTTWVPPSMDTPLRTGKRKEDDVDLTGMGYFVFPPNGSPASASKAPSNTVPTTPQRPSTFTQPSPRQPNAPSSSSSSQPLNIDSDLNSWDDHLASLHRARLDRETLEAQKGEEYWVSCGGVLRDAQGRRDLERTRQVRQKLQLREREKKLLETWEEYEKRWAEMVRKVRGVKGKGKQREADAGGVDGMENEESGCVTFHDIPWPVHIAFSPPPYSSSPSTSSLSFKPSPSPPSPYPPPPDAILNQLTSANIRAFLLDPLTVRGSKIAQRERIRSSMLRWHPDKMGGVVEKVEGEEEKEMVVRGVGEVVRALQGLMAEVGRDRNAPTGA